MHNEREKLGRSFYWLNTTQFLGAVNDNFFKLIIVLYLIGLHGEENASLVTSISLSVFVLPRR